MWGYAECVELMAGKGDRKLTAGERERLEWIGTWRPDAFDLAKARRRFDR